MLPEQMRKLPNAMYDLRPRCPLSPDLYHHYPFESNRCRHSEILFTTWLRKPVGKCPPNLHSEKSGSKQSLRKHHNNLFPGTPHLSHSY